MGTVSWTAGTGPLAPFADGFRQELLGLDHPPESVKHYLVLMGQLDGWLMVEGREVVELTAAVAEEFLVTRRARGQRRVPKLASLVPLFEYLKKQGAVRAEEPKPPTAREVLLAAYHHHLVHERGLTPSTVVRYERFARRFLASAPCARHRHRHGKAGQSRDQRVHVGDRITVGGRVGQARGR